MYIEGSRFKTKADILTSLSVSDHHVKMHNSKSGADIGAPRTLDAYGIPEFKPEKNRDSGLVQHGLQYDRVVI